MWKVILACAALGIVGATTTERAFAWGCVAVDSEGAYGYSYNWPSEQDAELTALQQCEKHTNSNDCQTESCDPNG